MCSTENVQQGRNKREITKIKLTRTAAEKSSLLEPHHGMGKKRLNNLLDQKQVCSASLYSATSS